jgi:hypothetical protein
MWEQLPTSAGRSKIRNYSVNSDFEIPASPAVATGNLSLICIGPGAGGRKS